MRVATLLVIIVFVFLGCGVAADKYMVKDEECGGHETAVHKWMRWYWETHTCNEGE